MRSPFPGMDPFIESFGLWGGAALHRLAGPFSAPAAAPFHSPGSARPGRQLGPPAARRRDLCSFPLRSRPRRSPAAQSATLPLRRRLARGAVGGTVQAEAARLRLNPPRGRGEAAQGEGGRGRGGPARAAPATVGEPRLSCCTRRGAGRGGRPPSPGRRAGGFDPRRPASVIRWVEGMTPSPRLTVGTAAVMMNVG